LTSENLLECIKIIHVPYKGINPALLDVLGGQVQALFISLQGAGRNIKTGKLRPLAITSLTRSPLAPDVPTLHESGYPNFQLTLGYGLAGPKGMPQDVVDKLNQAVKAALNEPDVREKLTTGIRHHRQHARGSPRVPRERDQQMGCGGQGRRERTLAAARRASRSRVTGNCSP
jgi:hypothetical protein